MLVEYAVNFDTNAYSEDAQSFERMVRKLQRMESRPAGALHPLRTLHPPHTLHTLRTLHALRTFHALRS